MEVLTLLLYPFLGCVMLILIHAYFGIHILERGIIFVDLSMAQFIALGISLSFLTGHEGECQYLYSLSFAFAGALILSLSRRITRFVNIEAFIGILYIFSLSTTILLLDRAPHGLEELKTILNGNILWLTKKDIAGAAVLYACIGVVHFIFRKRFFALSLENRGSVFWEFLFFFTFSLVLVSSVKLAGILQVFSFLLIPAVIGKLYTRNPAKVLLGGWLLGFLASISGILLSYYVDLPTAPLIVSALSLVFFVLLLFKMVRNLSGQKSGSRK